MTQTEQQAQNKKSNEKGMRAYGILTAIGLELIVLVVVAYFIGQWLDKTLGFKGIFMAGLIFVAFGLWIYLLIRALNKIENHDK